MKTKETPMCITISHYSGDEDGVSISVEDVVSGTEIVSLRMSHKQFGRALGSSASRPAMGQFRPHNFGLICEGKEIPVQGREKRPKETEDAYRSAMVAPHEVDGWIARKGDFGNGHRSLGNNRYSVTFTRFVPATEEALQEILRKHNERMADEELPR